MWTGDGRVHVIERGCGCVCSNFRFITCDCNWIPGTSSELRPLLNPWESWLKEGTVSKIIFLITSGRIAARLRVCRLRFKNPRPRVRIYRWMRPAAEDRMQTIRFTQRLQTCGCCHDDYRRKTRDDTSVTVSVTHRMHSGYINMKKIKAVERNHPLKRQAGDCDATTFVQRSKPCGSECFQLSADTFKRFWLAKETQNMSFKYHLHSKGAAFTRL